MYIQSVENHKPLQVYCWEIREGQMIINRRVLDRKLKKLNLTYGTLAELMGIHRGTFSNMLNGHTKPSYEVIHLMCYMLCLTPNEIELIFFGNKLNLSRHVIESYQKLYLDEQQFILLEESQKEALENLTNKTFY